MKLPSFKKDGTIFFLVIEPRDCKKKKKEKKRISTSWYQQVKLFLPFRRSGVMMRATHSLKFFSFPFTLPPLLIWVLTNNLIHEVFHCFPNWSLSLILSSVTSISCFLNITSKLKIFLVAPLVQA